MTNQTDYNDIKVHIQHLIDSYNERSRHCSEMIQTRAIDGYIPPQDQNREELCLISKRDTYDCLSHDLQNLLKTMYGIESDDKVSALGLKTLKLDLTPFGQWV